MLEIDNAVVKNYSEVMRSYMLRCLRSAKADVKYTFETVLKDHGIPVAKVITDVEGSQILPIGEKER